MHKLGKILQRSKLALKDAGIDSSSLDAILLLGCALNVSREYIIANPDYDIKSDEYNNFDKLLKRRILREPMSHILGYREFWGRNFKVTCKTLDPRPDSEIVIETVLEIYKNSSKSLNILDLGTGTGCLLLTVLCELSTAKATGVDISKDAISIAKENSVKLGLAKRTSFVVSNWLEGIKGEYDLIISNPPYIKRSDINGLLPEVSVYEPRVALDGGVSGLDCYYQLAPDIASNLLKDGYALLEHGIGQEQDIKAIMENVGLTFIDCKKDLAGINRCIVFRK